MGSSPFGQMTYNTPSNAMDDPGVLLTDGFDLPSPPFVPAPPPSLPSPSPHVRMMLTTDGYAIRGLLEVLLRKAGISLSECARRLGVSRESLRHYRSKPSPNPSLKWVLRLASVCGARIYIEFDR